MLRFLLISSAPDSLWAVETAAALGDLGAVQIAPSGENLAPGGPGAWDLIILDTVERRDEDVLALVTGLREADPAVSIVVATASPTWSRARNVFLAGATEYMRKTTDRATLLATLAPLLSLPPSVAVPDSDPWVD